MGSKKLADAERITDIDRVTFSQQYRKCTKKDDL